MRLVLLVAALALIPALSSCGGSDARSSDGGAATAGAPTVLVPTIAAKAETPLALTQGDTAITLSAEPAKLTVTQKTSEQAASGIGSSVGGKYRYTVTSTDVAEFDPDRLQLLVALKNTGKSPMSYEDGMQIEYLLDGKPVDFSHSSEGVSIHSVPSGGTAFIRISGPKIASLKEGQQAVLTLHNLPIKGAGKPGERAQVSWQFAIKAERTVELKTTTKTEWR